MMAIVHPLSPRSPKPNTQLIGYSPGFPGENHYGSDNGSEFLTEFLTTTIAQLFITIVAAPIGIAIIHSCSEGQLKCA